MNKQTNKTNKQNKTNNNVNHLNNNTIKKQNKTKQNKTKRRRPHEFNHRLSCPAFRPSFSPQNGKSSFFPSYQIWILRINLKNRKGVLARFAPAPDALCLEFLSFFSFLFFFIVIPFTLNLLLFFSYFFCGFLL